MANIKQYKNEINFEGCFQNNDGLEYHLYQPVYFFKNGLMYYDLSSIKEKEDEQILTGWYKNYLAKSKEWGGFEIRSDTVDASVYINYINGNNVHLITNFKGIILDSTTIIDWQVVEPYPNLKGNIRKYYLQFLTEHTTLHFTSMII